MREYSTHSSKVHSVDWSCDGKRLASGTSTDNRGVQHLNSISEVELRHKCVGGGGIHMLIANSRKIVQKPSEYRTPEYWINLNTGQYGCLVFKWLSYVTWGNI